MKRERPKAFKIRSICPVEVRRPWTWTNFVVDGRVWISQHPGAIELPRDFCGCFDFSMMKISGPSGAPFGTQNIKSIFTTACRYLGPEKCLEEQPSLEAITDAFVAWNERLYRSLPEGSLEYFVLGDDLAGNGGLMMSPELYRKWIKPCHARLFEIGKKNRSKLVFHSDGDILDIIRDLAEMEVDIVLVQGVGRMAEEIIKPNRSRGVSLIEHDAEI
jgi:hypothetical protein